MFKKIFSYILLICQILIPIAGLCLHIYTVYLFAQEGFLEALISFCLPILSEIWYAVSSAFEFGILNAYTSSILIYFLTIILYVIAVYGIVSCEEAESEGEEYECLQPFLNVNKNDVFLILVIIIIIVLFGILIFQNNQFLNNENPIGNVCITITGSKYHLSNCKTLKGSYLCIPLQDAIDLNYKPCSICINN